MPSTACSKETDLLVWNYATSEHHSGTVFAKDHREAAKMALAAVRQHPKLFNMVRDKSVSEDRAGYTCKPATVGYPTSEIYIFVYTGKMRHVPEVC